MEKEYWKGYTDAQKQAEGASSRLIMEMQTDFIEVLEDARIVKGIGPKSHRALVEFGMERIMHKADPKLIEITKNERSRIVKELANTKWSNLSDDDLIQMQNILKQNQGKQA